MLRLAHHRLRLSDRAQAKIRSVLAERGDTGEAVRVFAEKTADGAVELGLALDQRRADDILVPAEGVTVLADAQTLAVARDRVIDYEPQGFTFARNSACEAHLFTE
jgi:Fe-S cluster assembly iron-binding protein IscA